MLLYLKLDGWPYGVSLSRKACSSFGGSRQQLVVGSAVYIWYRHTSEFLFKVLGHAVCPLAVHALCVRHAQCVNWVHCSPANGMLVGSTPDDDKVYARHDRKRVRYNLHAHENLVCMDVLSCAVMNRNSLVVRRQCQHSSHGAVHSQHASGKR